MFHNRSVKGVNSAAATIFPLVTEKYVAFHDENRITYARIDNLTLMDRAITPPLPRRIRNVTRSARL